MSQKNLEQLTQEQNQATPCFSKVLKEAFERLLARVHVSMPGEIREVYDDGTADVQPLLMKNFILAGGPTPYPVIPKVPIIFMGPTNGWLRFPLDKGDPCLLLFADRSLDNWWSQGGQQDPQDSRMFQLSDAICIPGLRSSQQAITPHGARTSIELALGNAWVEITNAGKFKMKNASTDLTTILGDLTDTMTGATAGGNPVIWAVKQPALIKTEILNLLA